MFVKNNQISGRQVFRLLFFDLLGFGALMIPARLANASGRDGIFSIGLGIFFSFLFLKLLSAVLQKMEGDYSSYIRKSFGNVAGSVVLIGYSGYFILLAGYISYLLSKLVLTNLLKEESFFLVLTLLLLLAFYGVSGGIEGRARVYELLFWVLFVPLFLMLLFAAGEMNLDYWTPIITADALGITRGGYYVFLCFSFLFLLLFLHEYLKDAGKLAGAGKNAMVLAGVIMGVLYMILLGTFGAKALSVMDFPAVTLMSRVQITGGFFKRTDAFMFGIWFFSLYALLNSAIFYAGKVTADFFETETKKGKLWFLAGTLVAVFALAYSFYYSDGMCEWYEKFLWYVGTPFVVLIPLLLYGRQKFCDKKEIALREQKKAEREWKKILKKAGKTSFILVFSLLLSGCKTAQLEDRSFPVFLAVKNTEDFCEGWLNKQHEGNLTEDYNHLKVILIERSFIEDMAKMSELLALLEQDKNVPQNTYVMVTDSVDEIAGTEEALGESLGDYLEEMIENASHIKKDACPTLGMLYQEKENRLETLYIPCLKVQEGKPAITEYEVWKRGDAAGLVDTDVAMLSFFLCNQLKEYTLKLEENHFITLRGGRNEFIFTEEIEKSGITQKHVKVKVVCEGELRYQKELLSGEENKKNLEKQLMEYFTMTADRALGQGIDVTNGYKKLGGYQREWYSKYGDSPQFWEEDMVIDFSFQINWTN